MEVENYTCSKVATLTTDQSEDNSEVEKLIENLSNWMSSLSLAELETLQKADPHISKVAAWKAVNRNKPPSRSEISALSDTVKTLCGRWKCLERHQGVLYRRWSLKHDPDQHTLQVVATTCIQSEIFRQLHG